MERQGMCGLCGVLGIEHWTEEGVRGGPTPRQARLRRARFLNDLLSLYRIRVDDWQGASMAICGPTGRTELADTLTDFWPKAEAIAGRALDPLDPDLLAHLRRITAGR
jgi:hypothetical protein